MVWLFAVTLGFMEVIEFGAANWGGLYLKDVYALIRVLSEQVLCPFFIYCLLYPGF
jgi:hypothetical protein